MTDIVNSTLPRLLGDRGRRVDGRRSLQRRACCRERIRDRSGAGEYIAALAVCAVFVLVAYAFLHDLTLDATWARALGLPVLVASTAFTLWARFALGTMWSVAPEVGGDRRLRTNGPYGVTRHPIYSGLLGMLIGTMFLAGIHEFIAIIPAGLVVLEVKMRQEERLMLSTFPDEYQAYRRRVPQIVPGSTSCGAVSRLAGSSRGVACATVRAAWSAHTRRQREADMGTRSVTLGRPRISGAIGTLFCVALAVSACVASEADPASSSASAAPPSGLPQASPTSTTPIVCEDGPGAPTYMPPDCVGPGLPSYALTTARPHAGVASSEPSAQPP